jgi:hypothetical protein
LHGRVRRLGGRSRASVVERRGQRILAAGPFGTVRAARRAIQALLPAGNGREIGLPSSQPGGAGIARERDAS